MANSYTPGPFDGWMGDVMTGAAMGALTGGLFGGLNVSGRIGSHRSNANGGLFGQGFGGFLDRMSNPFADLSPQDIAAYGLDVDWTAREPTMTTGYGGAPGDVGDGSYSDDAGYNDNNPQGML